MQLPRDAWSLGLINHPLLQPGVYKYTSPEGRGEKKRARGLSQGRTMVAFSGTGIGFPPVDPCTPPPFPQPSPARHVKKFPVEMSPNLDNRRVILTAVSAWAAGTL